MHSSLTPQQLAECKNGDDSEKLNLLLGLYPNGFVRNILQEKLGIEDFQILTLYRTEMFGSMKLSDLIKTTYPRGHWTDPIFGGVRALKAKIEDIFSFEDESMG